MATNIYFDNIGMAKELKTINLEQEDLKHPYHSNLKRLIYDIHEAFVGEFSKVTLIRL